MKRKVRGLRWARRLEKAPGFNNRVRGIKAQGIRWEKELKSSLQGWQKGIWWEFEDLNGHGLCQTDFVKEIEDKIFVLEAKNTWTEEAWDELDNLYLPIVSVATCKKAFGIQVVRNLTKEASGKIYSSLEASLFAAPRNSVQRITFYAGLGTKKRPKSRGWVDEYDLEGIKF